MYAVTSMGFGNDGLMLTLVHVRGVFSIHAPQKVTPDELDLIEFTGLKDKHGKEIWQGDIVCIPDIGSRGNLYQVLWNDDRWGLNDKYGHGYDSGDYYLGHEISWDEAEVIGNIYEHPELLRKEE